MAAREEGALLTGAPLLSLRRLPGFLLLGKLCRKLGTNSRGQMGPSIEIAVSWGGQSDRLRTPYKVVTALATGKEGHERNAVQLGLLRTSRGILQRLGLVRSRKTGGGLGLVRTKSSRRHA